MIESARAERGPVLKNFETIPKPNDYDEIFERITRSLVQREVSSPHTVQLDVIDGFEDVIEGPLGVGLFYNTAASVHQLIFALSIAENAALKNLLRAEKIPPAECVKICREHKVLSGLKIIDLGCGKPNFAMAAQSLGAQAYSVDVMDISEADKKKLAGHMVLDLNQTNAIDALIAFTGGNFDLVSENMVGTTFEMPKNVLLPSPERIVQIGDVLLKSGGYLYYTRKSFAQRERMLRKK